jgi:nucleoside-diphosphate-sugar epimerase
MKRVLVTGATGCVGRYAVPMLVARGWEVHAVASRQVPQRLAGVTWHRADLLKPAQMRDVVQQSSASHLLHLAWYVAPGKWAMARENFDWVRASLDLAQAFRADGGKRMVMAGSCLEYDWNYGYCSESRTPCTPHTAYGACKHALQLLTSALTADDTMTSAWGRIFFLYGPHEHPDRLVGSVIRSLLANEPALCSHGNQIRDYLFAGDVADALVALLESDATGPINIGSGQPVALNEVIGLIGKLLDRSHLIRLGAIPAAATDTPLVVADTTRLSAMLRWEPRWDLDAGLATTIDWWRTQVNVVTSTGPEPGARARTPC